MQNFNTHTLDSTDFQDMRLDKALPLLFTGHTRSFYESLFDKKLILVNQKAVKKSYKLSLHDLISIEIPAPAINTLAKQDLSLEIIYEDDHLLIINKPAGLVVHPAAGHYDHTLVNGILYHCELEKEQDSLRPGIVHRLDKDTSGLIITCKTLQAHEGMSQLFMNRTIKKSYLAICLGKVIQETIEAPIARHKNFRQKMAVSFSEKAKSATTIVTSLFHDHEISLAKLDIITGRTHQIRVHMQHKKTPVLGDLVYGYPNANASFKAQRQYLHAFEVFFIHPITNVPLHIKAPLAEDMRAFLAARKVDPSLYQ
jgi:23S rRNA pseudouridine1911/1915/1917 synthase